MERLESAAAAVGVDRSLGATLKKLALASVLVCVGSAACGKPAERAELPRVALGSLPAQAQSTHRLILSGGPFPYPAKDGSVFGNRERVLPKHPRGYYREYTVPTPGARDRGARRIVCGGELPRQPEVCYYTADHYNSFSRISP